MSTRWIKNEIAIEYINKLKELYIDSEYHGSCVMFGNGTAKFKLEGVNSIILQLKYNLKQKLDIPFNETELALYRGINICAENNNWNFNFLSEQITA